MKAKGSIRLFSPEIFLRHALCPSLYDRYFSSKGRKLNRILIVEDDANALSGLQVLLEHENYTVFSADCGKAALSVAEENRFDIVLCDYRLPDIDGISLCRKITRNTPETIVFLLTAYHNSEIKTGAEKSQIRKIFFKPINIELLLQSLREVSRIGTSPSPATGAGSSPAQGPGHASGKATAQASGKGEFAYGTVS